MKESAFYAVLPAMCDERDSIGEGRANQLGFNAKGVLRGEMDTVGLKISG